jgi:hypothetical protein
MSCVQRPQPAKPHPSPSGDRKPGKASKHLLNKNIFCLCRETGMAISYLDGRNPEQTPADTRLLIRPDDVAEVMPGMVMLRGDRAGSKLGRVETSFLAGTFGEVGNDQLDTGDRAFLCSDRLVAKGNPEQVRISNPHSGDRTVLPPDMLPRANHRPIMP